jgi:hypothetical protein
MRVPLLKYLPNVQVFSVLIKNILSVGRNEGIEELVSVPKCLFTGRESVVLPEGSLFAGVGEGAAIGASGPTLPARDPFIATFVSIGT